jgi:DnaJ family protein C protein 3
MRTFSFVLSSLVAIIAVRGDEVAKDPIKIFNAAEREFRNNNFDGALKLYTESLSLAPQPKTYYARYKVYLKLRKIPHALADLTAAIEADTNYAMAYLQRANLLLLTGKCREAVQDYESVLRLDATKRDAQTKMPHARTCEAAIAQAERARQIGDWHSAREMLSQAMEDERATAAPGLLLQRAECHFHLGDMEQTMGDTARVLKMEESSLAAYELRARALARYGDYGTARSHYQRCLVFDPEHKDCKKGYQRMKSILRTKEQANAAMDQGRWDEAASLWEAGLDTDNDNPNWRRELLPKLAKSQLKRKDLAAAEKYARLAIEADDNNAEAHYVLGEVFLSAENYDEAARQGHRAHEIDRGNNDYASFAQRADAALKQSKSKDFYKILGVTRDADERVIKKAYRQLAREWHPDMHSDSNKEAAEKKFKDIAEAHDVLTDPEKKERCVLSSWASLCDASGLVSCSVALCVVVCRYDRGEDVTGNPQQQQQGGGFHPFFNQGGFQQQSGFTFTFRTG